MVPGNREVLCLRKVWVVGGALVVATIAGDLAFFETARGLITGVVGLAAALVVLEPLLPVILLANFLKGDIDRDNVPPLSAFCAF